MTTEQQEVWLRAAIDALQDIRAIEVRSVILELQRTVQRPNQIVPEIARLVGDKRKRSQQSTAPRSPFHAERDIYAKADEMRAIAAKLKDKRERSKGMSDAFEWERQALAAAAGE